MTDHPARAEPTPEIWTSQQVADHLDIAITSVLKTMARWQVPVVDREPGRTGRARYRADHVRAAAEAAPGKGNRTTGPRRRAEPPAADA